MPNAKEKVTSARDISELYDPKLSALFVHKSFRARLSKEMICEEEKGWLKPIPYNSVTELISDLISKKIYFQVEKQTNRLHETVIFDNSHNFV